QHVDFFRRLKRSRAGKSRTGYGMKLSLAADGWRGDRIAFLASEADAFVFDSRRRCIRNNRKVTDRLDWPDGKPPIGTVCFQNDVLPHERGVGLRCDARQPQSPTKTSGDVRPPRNPPAAALV